MIAFRWTGCKQMKTIKRWRRAGFGLGFLALTGSLNAQEAAPPLPEDSLYAQDRITVTQPFDAAGFAKTFSHHKATVNGKAVHYVIGGKGEAILLLHGWPESWYSWRRVMPRLAEKHTVIAVDLPGFGDSDALGSAEKRAVAAHLFAWLTQIGVSRVSLVAHDMGEPVAYAFAAAYPGSVRKVVFAEGAIPGFGFADGSPSDLLKLTPQSVGGVWHFPFFMNPDKAELLVQGRESAFVTLMTKDSFYNPAAFSTEEHDEITRWLAAPGGFRSSTAYYAVLFTDAAQNQAAKVKLAMPVLVMDGEYGFLKSANPASVKQIAVNVRTLVVPRSGHFIADERPAFAALQIALFLDEKPDPLTFSHAKLPASASTSVLWTRLSFSK